MSKIELIDTLAQKEPNCAYFDVNTAASNVILNKPALGMGILYNGDGDSKFFSQDNIIILSIGYVLPMGFELFFSTSGINGNLFELPIVQARFKVVGIGFTPVQAKIIIPFPSYELSWGLFRSSPAGTQGYEIVFDWSNDLLISMIGVPQSLNEARFYVPIFIKVSHTLNIESIT